MNMNSYYSEPNHPISSAASKAESDFPFHQPGVHFMSTLWDFELIPCPQNGISVNSCVHFTGSILEYYRKKESISGVRREYPKT